MALPMAVITAFAIGALLVQPSSASDDTDRSLALQQTQEQPMVKFSRAGLPAVNGPAKNGSCPCDVENGESECYSEDGRVLFECYENAFENLRAGFVYEGEDFCPNGKTLEIAADSCLVTENASSPEATAAGQQYSEHFLPADRFDNPDARYSTFDGAPVLWSGDGDFFIFYCSFAGRWQLAARSEWDLLGTMPCYAFGIVHWTPQPEPYNASNTSSTSVMTGGPVPGTDVMIVVARTFLMASWRSCSNELFKISCRPCPFTTGDGRTSSRSWATTRYTSFYTSSMVSATNPIAGREVKGCSLRCHSPRYTGHYSYQNFKCRAYPAPAATTTHSPEDAGSVDSAADAAAAASDVVKTVRAFVFLKEQPPPDCNFGTGGTRCTELAVACIQAADDTRVLTAIQSIASYEQSLVEVAATVQKASDVVATGPATSEAIYAVTVAIDEVYRVIAAMRSTRFEIWEEARLLDPTLNPKLLYYMMVAAGEDPTITHGVEEMRAAAYKLRVAECTRTKLLEAHAVVENVLAILAEVSESLECIVVAECIADRQATGHLTVLGDLTSVLGRITAALTMIEAGPSPAVPTTQLSAAATGEVATLDPAVARLIPGTATAVEDEPGDASAEGASVAATSSEGADAGSDPTSTPAPTTQSLVDGGQLSAHKVAAKTSWATSDMYGKHGLVVADERQKSAKAGKEAKKGSAKKRKDGHIKKEKSGKKAKDGSKKTSKKKKKRGHGWGAHETVAARRSTQAATFGALSMVFMLMAVLSFGAGLVGHTKDKSAAILKPNAEQPEHNLVSSRRPLLSTLN